MISLNHKFSNITSLLMLLIMTAMTVTLFFASSKATVLAENLEAQIEYLNI